MAISYPNTKHIVAESSRLKATTAGHIYDLKLHEARDNGTIVSIDELSTTVANNPSVQVFKSKDAADTGKLYLILQPPFNYDNARKAMSEEQFFSNEANDVVRAYELYEDDIFTISFGVNGSVEYGVDPASTAPAVGNYVYFDGANNIWKEVDAVPEAGVTAATYNCFCQIVEVVSYQNAKAIRVRVLDLHKTIAAA